MPAEPSPQLLNKMFRRPEGSPYTGGMESLPPSILRTGFEGIMDMVRGAMGGGTDNTMNRVGELAMAGLPFFSRASRMAQLANAGLGGENRALQLQQAGLMPRKPVYDEAGRFLATEAIPDEAMKYALPHRAVSFGGEMGETPQLKALNPSDEQYRRMMEGRWRQPR